MIKKLTAFVLAVIMLAALPLNGTAEEYKDIAGHNLEKEMLEAIDKEILRGYGNGRFGPDDPVTRAQFATFLDRALGLPHAPTDIEFSDVDEDTHILASSVYRAAAAGIVSGYPGGTFRPEEHITREQMAVMIDRSLTLMGVPHIRGDLNFTDREQIRTAFEGAVASNAYYGIILGSPVGDTNMYRFAPKDNATRAHASAFIVRMLTTVEMYQVTEEPVEDPGDPDAERDTYQIARITNEGEIIAAPREFNTLAGAQQVQGGTFNLLLKNGKVLDMDDGIVRPRNPASSIIYIYTAGNLVTAKTYVTDDVRFGSELEYIETDSEEGSYIKVGYAGTTGYVNPDQVQLVPSEKVAAEGRSHYQVNQSGNLVHYLYNPVTDGHVSYTYGPAPGFLNTGQRYYSWDGSTFLTEGGGVAGTAEQYFNSMPVKSETNYTAEDLDRYLEEMSPSGVASPLAGEGAAFIEAQETYGINALYLMAKAIHESAWGTSRIAQDKNNLFGLNASDDNPYGNADEFHSFEDSILYAGQYIAEGYANVRDWRFNGSILGNKGKGFNVRYASDMFWGQKIAGHMYRADNYLGGEDHKYYDVAKTTASGLNVRANAGTNFDPLYQYPRSGAYVIKFDERQASNGHIWHEVTADHPDYRRGYIHSAYLEKLSFPE